MILSSSVQDIGAAAFVDCKNLRLADLRAANGLKCLERKIFSGCENFKYVLLGEGLEVIEREAFMASGLENFVAPASLREIKNSAFKNCGNLRHVDLSACGINPAKK